MMFQIRYCSRNWMRSGLRFLGSTLLLVPGAAAAQSAQADAMASCNASFHLNCIGTSTTINFVGSAAPLDGVGDLTIELLLVLVLMVMFSLRGRAQFKQRAQLVNAGGSFGNPSEATDNLAEVVSKVELFHESEDVYSDRAANWRVAGRFVVAMSKLNS